MNAVLYVRVSTGEQGEGPLNLSSQEKTCRNLCAMKGYNVFKVFVAAGESARTKDRPTFQEMLSFCKQHRREVDCVVVQDLSRFARNNSDQALCIAELKKHGIKLYSVFEQNIGDTAAGKLAANIHGTFNQYFSDALSEKMKERMEASAASGRFPWPAPVGYLNVKGSPNIVPDPERAPLIARAFELVAAGHKRADVLKTINDAGLRTKQGNRLSGQTFHALLHKPIYVGWICPPSMPVRVKGLHQPLVSEDLFNAVQQILSGKKPVVVRKAYNADFPLKVLVKCAVCGTGLTGGMCKGRTKSYAHYWCRRMHCRAVKTTKQNLETIFIDLLKKLRPRDEVISSFPKIAERVFAEQQAGTEANTKQLTARLEKAKHLKSALLTAKLSGEVTQDDYEQARAELAVEITGLEQQLQAAHATAITLDGFMRFVELSLSDIAKAWQLAEAEKRQTVQTLLFEDGLAYDQKSNSLNHPNSCLFSVLEQISTDNLLLASPTGFEPVLPP
jgi:site-specific DNA recombinase